jgi:hypothetical protein
VLNFFDLRHNLRDPEKDTDSCQTKQDAPNELKFGFLICHTDAPFPQIGEAELG